ncbi:hypothetical protein JCM19000A_30590 [Silvimonas sp. JCM 19000]
MPQARAIAPGASVELACGCKDEEAGWFNVFPIAKTSASLRPGPTRAGQRLTAQPGPGGLVGLAIGGRRAESLF